MTTPCLIPDMGRPCGLCEACQAERAGPVCPMCGATMQHPMIGSGGMVRCTSCVNGIQRGVTDYSEEECRIEQLTLQRDAIAARACGLAFAAGMELAEKDRELDRVRAALLRGAA